MASSVTMIHHVGIVLLLLWILNCYNCCHFFAYFLSLLYLCLVHEKYFTRLKRRLRFEEKRQTYQRRVLSDSETVRWLNQVIENTWPICMEQILSQKILLPIIPWFMQKYKPWTVKDVVVQHLYLGRCPPLFTEIRVVHHRTGDDHLVLELGMNFCTADDMNAIIAVKLRRRLGFGMWAKLHLLGMHIEGKVLVGVRFLPKWPFVGRLRVCFAEPPYFQMTVKPIFSHGLDITELPGIAGWVDNLVALAFKQTLVEPNMLVVDMEKFASPQAENWFSIDVKETISHVILEVVEAADIKPSDLNGLADPYLKGRLGPYRFRTKIQWKTLNPKWHEEFKIPVSTWESPKDELKIKVRDKDRFVDDALGDCVVKVSSLRDGQRHDMWLPLHNVKTGRLHIAITVIEGEKLIAKEICAEECGNDDEQTRDSFKNDANGGDTISLAEIPDNKSPNVEDRYEPIKIQGNQGTGIWVHHPGTEVAQIWESRKGKNSIRDDEKSGEDSNSLETFKLKSLKSDGNRLDDREGGGRRTKKIARGWNKISAVFHRRQRNGNFEISVESSCGRTPKAENGKESPRIKGRAKDKVKNILKHAGSFASSCGGSHSRKGSKLSNTVESAESTPSRDNRDFFSESGNDSSQSRELTSGTSNASATNSKPHR